MHIGLIGLGKMGFNMRERLRKGGIEVTGFDRNPDVTDVATVDELIAAVPAPRLIWVMVPSGDITDAVITELGNKLDAGDLVIDGGNSRFTEDQKHGAALAEKGIRFADCGVSGGVWGLQNGYGLMAGGDAADIERALPVFDALRPEGERADSFVHVGGIGAGHYAKMVHNGIEYGLMQAYAEGYELLAAKDIVDRPSRNVPRLAKGHRGPVLAAGPHGQGPGRGSRDWNRSTTMSRIPAKAAGPWRKPSPTPCRHRPSRPRCLPASPPARTTRRP